MTAPTVASLCSVLGNHLVPVVGFRPPDTEISAVHISELQDPNAYLTGGELLLTTGLTLPRNGIDCRRYVARLVEAEVSALALGLGPVHQRPPQVLVNACREAGLTLLAVPAPTPFLTISRAFWQAVSRSTERQLNDAVAAHRALVDAAIAPDPAAAILRRLARVLDGWAALLDLRGEVDQIYPLGLVEDVEALRAEVLRLEVAGLHSSASFGMADHVVVVFPLAAEGRVIGYLAAGSPRQLEPSQRRVVLTAAALLSLHALRVQRTESARGATRRCVAILVDLGLVEAARRLAVETGTPLPSRAVSIVAVRGRDIDFLVRAVERWCPGALTVGVNGTSAWFLIPGGRRTTAELEHELRAADPAVAAVVSELVAIESVGSIRSRALRTLGALGPGEIALPRDLGGTDVAQEIDRFAVEASPEVRAALVAFLRHRGQWEQAAKSLDLHRNTLRYRVGKARDLLGIDLDDPDVFAETWLALRVRALA